jgi:hypothetical protein
MLRRPLPLVVALLLVAPALASAQARRDTQGEAEMLERINALRVEASLPPLVRHAGLDEAARVHSVDMAEHDMLAHVSPRTGDPAARVREAGVQAARIAQNIAVRHTTADALLSILSSPPHRQQLLDPALTHIGLAAIAGDRGVYVTQVMAQLEGPTPLPPPAFQTLNGEPAAPAPQAAPEASPQASEPSPDASGASDQASEPSSDAPEASYQAPEAPDQAPEAPDQAPEASDQAPEASYQASEAPPQASEPSPEAPAASPVAPEAPPAAPEPAPRAPQAAPMPPVAAPQASASPAPAPEPPRPLEAPVDPRERSAASPAPAAPSAPSTPYYTAPPAGDPYAAAPAQPYAYDGSGTGAIPPGAATVASGAQGAPTLRLPLGARPGVSGYWLFYGSRWWYFPIPAGAGPNTVLQADPSFSGPPPGYDGAGQQVGGYGTQPAYTPAPTTYAPPATYAPAYRPRRPPFGWSPRRHYQLWIQRY